MPVPNRRTPRVTPVSKQDSQFFNVFSLVIGILVAIALVLMGVARAIGRNNQAEHVLQDAKYVAQCRAKYRAAGAGSCRGSGQQRADHC